MGPYEAWFKLGLETLWSNLELGPPKILLGLVKEKNKLKKKNQYT